MPWNLESLSWAQARIFVANYQQNRWVFLVKYCVQHQKGHYQGHDEQCCGQLRCQNALNHLHNHHHSWDRLEWVLRAEKESVIFIALSFWIQNGAEFVAGKAVTWAIEKGCPCTVEKNWDAHFRTVSVPKRTTSSDRISYIIPVRLRYASSASASPGVCIDRWSVGREWQSNDDHTILHSKPKASTSFTWKSSLTITLHHW